MRCCSTGSASAATSSRRRGEAPLEQRAGTAGEHQRLAGARSRTPGDAAGIGGVLLRPGGADELQDRLDHALADGHAAHELLRRHQLVPGQHLARVGIVEPGRLQQDAPLGIAVRIDDVDLHDEAVELGLRQRVGAFLLERVLRREDVEGRRQRVRVAGDGDEPLLHRLQQRRLGARRGAVDLVRHQELGEHRTLDEAEGALTGLRLLQHLGAQNVGRHEVWRELDASLVEPEHGAERRDEARLREARNADQERMTAAQHGDQRALDDVALAENDPFDLALRVAEASDRCLELFHVVVLIAIDDAREAVHNSPLRGLATGHPASVKASSKPPSPNHLSMVWRARCCALCAWVKVAHVAAPCNGRARGPVAHHDDEAATGPLAALIARAAELGGGAAPVDRWDPPDCGAIPMRIAADGVWHYNGSPILRERLVRLFASVLRREGDGTFVLVTPVEKVTIEVDDAPFQAVEIAADGTGETATLTVRTNTGDVLVVGADHPLRIGGVEDAFVPYVTVRRGLEARLTRAAALELADLAVDGPDGRLGVWSGGGFFPFEATPVTEFDASVPDVADEPRAEARCARDAAIRPPQPGDPELIDVVSRAARLHPPLGQLAADAPVYGDHILNPHSPRRADAPPPRRAAVLVALTADPDRDASRSSSPSARRSFRPMPARSPCRAARSRPGRPPRRPP